MSISAVIGVGPRCGTSWLMHQLDIAGLDVYSTPGTDDHFPVEGNPEGYYETDLYEREDLEDVIIKVWPGPDMYDLDYDRVVVLRRSADSQIPAMRKQLEREGLDENSEQMPVSVEELLTMSEVLVQDLDTDTLEVRTEDLDDRLPEIIKYMRGTD